MQNNLRAFVAVPIPEGVIRFLKRIRTRLETAGMDMRWVAAKNIHLTLKFFGEIDPSRLPAVTAKMDAVAAKTPSFALAAAGVGVFPNLHHARVLWVGLSGDLDRLSDIQSALESGLETVGFRRELRDFSAHLTIGRTRRRIDGRTIGSSLEPLKDASSESFRVDRLLLVKSTLNPAGAEYTLLHTSHLAI